MCGILMPTDARSEMTQKINLSFEQIARWVISGAWIFHGLIPKLIHIAPAEWYLSSQFGFNKELTYWMITFAGIVEVSFGLLFFIFYKNRWVNILNMAGLVALIIMVAFLDWHYLFGAFNPITTNIPLIVLSLYLLNLDQK